ncbi:DUF1534 domain-containing protein [Pseudomonas syringae pv. actinidiae]|nr:DUF1534 domain-containing protein [Pseudomonas syringae pv. actinidiae]
MSCVVRESNLISPRCTFKIGRRASRTACRRRASHDNLVTTAPTKTRTGLFRTCLSADQVR